MKHEALKEGGITAEELPEELRIVIRDEFVAAVQKRGNELMLRFPHGECFALALRQICRKETENA